MSQHLLDDLGVYAFGEVQGRSRMPQIVEPRIERQSRFIQQRLPRATMQIMDAQGRTDSRAEDPLANPSLLPQYPQ